MEAKTHAMEDTYYGSQDNVQQTDHHEVNTIPQGMYVSGSIRIHDMLRPHLPNGIPCRNETICILFQKS